MKKIVICSLFLVLSAPLVSFAYSANTSTVVELQAQIANLLAQIQQLQAKLAQMQGGQTTSWCHTFNTDFGVGNSGSEVSALQNALENNGPQIKGGWNPSIFDELTASAVSSFQQKYKGEILTPAGLYSPTGYVGPRTRAKLNALYGCTTTPSPMPTPTPMACTADAKLCPDGTTYVGRTGPNCEFSACPTVNSSQPIIISTSAKAAGNFEADAGGEMTIKGQNLYSFCCKYDSRVFMGGIEATINSVIPDALSIKVPDSLATGQTYDLYVTTFKGTSNIVKVKILSNLKAPIISYINPTSAKAGEIVTVHGNNLYGNILVIDGNTQSTSNVNYLNSDPLGYTLAFEVPAFLSTGDHTIQIEQKIVGGRSNSVDLNVLPKLASSSFDSFSINPSSISPGQPATVSYSSTNVYVEMSMDCPVGVTSPYKIVGDACGQKPWVRLEPWAYSTQIQLNNSSTQNQQVTITANAYDLSGSLVGTKYAYVTVAPAATISTVPPMPINIRSACPSPGTSATISWTAPDGYNSFYLRIKKWPHPADGTNVLWNDNYNGTSYSFPTTPGNYNWWVHTRDGATGAYSEAIGEIFTCPNQPTALNSSSNSNQMASVLTSVTVILENMLKSLSR